jgi:hypothetical protein
MYVCLQNEKKYLLLPNKLDIKIFFSMEISAIKQQLTLSGLISYYGLKADKQNRLRCPFHDDRTPSL